MGSLLLRMFLSVSAALRPSSKAAIKANTLSSPMPMCPIFRSFRNATKLRNVGYLRNSANVAQDARNFIAASRTLVPFTPLRKMFARSTSSGTVTNSAADEIIFMRSRG